MPLEIARDRLDPTPPLRSNTARLFSDLPSSLYAKPGGDISREAFDLARPQREAVVGDRAGVSHRTLDDVEPVHLSIAVEKAAAVGELARVSNERRPAGEEIGVERENNVSVLEAVDRVDRLAERHPRACHRVVAIDRFVLMPPRRRESGAQRFDLIG